MQYTLLLMDLRTLPTGLSPSDRVDERRARIEKELGIDLGSVRPSPDAIGHADEKNCEQMFGMVGIPVGYAGPLPVTFSSGQRTLVHLPLATTEGALVASVNRGCKALGEGGVRTSSVQHGVSRSLAFKLPASSHQLSAFLQKSESQWRKIGEETSDHLHILRYDIDQKDDYLFLTIYADTDEAMGMNMVTIAASAIGKWVEENAKNVDFVTVAGNVDSDKKPSVRTKERGRGYEVTAEAVISGDVINNILKSSPERMMEIAHAKLEIGSSVAGSLGKNLHAANIIAALYLATGQDAAHVVEGSLADTIVEIDQPEHVILSSPAGRPSIRPRGVYPDEWKELRSTQGDTAGHIEGDMRSLRISVHLPALLVGVRGGGTGLPAQSQCLQLLLKDKTSLHPKAQLAESIGAAVLAGEISLLGAQASHQLANAHQRLGR